MELDAFKQGEAKAKLEGIESDVAEMKSDIKTIDAKIDDVDRSAHAAASLAKSANDKVDERHLENKKHMDSIEAKIDKLNNKMTTVYGVAAGISIAGTFAATWFRDKIMGKT